MRIITELYYFDTFVSVYVCNSVYASAHSHLSYLGLNNLKETLLNIICLIDISCAWSWVVWKDNIQWHCAIHILYCIFTGVWMTNDIWTKPSVWKNGPKSRFDSCQNRSSEQHSPKAKYALLYQLGYCYCEGEMPVIVCSWITQCKVLCTLRNVCK